MMSNNDDRVYPLLGGERLSLDWLTKAEIGYLKALKRRVDEGEDYFELFKEIRSEDSAPLKTFGGRVTPEAVRSVFFMVAQDIVERAGIKQGRAARPSPNVTSKATDLVSIPEAAQLIGRTRAAIHLAVQRHAIRAWKIGHSWILDVESVREYDRKYSKDGNPLHPAPKA